MHRDTFRADQRCSKCGEKLGKWEYKNHYCPSRATCKICQKLNDKRLGKIHHQKTKKKYHYPPEPSQKQKFHYSKTYNK